MRGYLGPQEIYGRRRALWLVQPTLRREGERVNEFSEAPPKPPPADPVAGEFITETFDYDGGRLVTVYVPPDPPEAIGSFR